MFWLLGKLPHTVTLQVTLLPSCTPPCLNKPQPLFLFLPSSSSCAVAEVGLGLPISSMGNPWWIMMDAQFMEGHIGEGGSEGMRD
jgi:hypothetical protein